MILDESPTFLPNLLMVDDEEINLAVMHEALKGMACIYQCTSGAEALAMARIRAFDVILLDIDMPEMDGLTLCEQLKTMPYTAHSSIIFVTGHTDPEIEFRCLALGAMDFLSKPVDIKLCQLRVRNHLNLKFQEAKLLDAKRDIHELVRQVPIHISYWSMDFVCQFSNDFQGHTSDVSAHFAKPIDNVFPEKLSNAIKAKAKLARYHEQVFDLFFDGQGQSAQDLQVTVSCRERNGLLEGFLVTLSDISSIKQAERALANEKERLNVMLNSIGDAVIATDQAQCITFMNPVAQTMTGWTLEQAKGRPILEVMQLTDADTGTVLPNPISIALKQKGWCR